MRAGRQMKPKRSFHVKQARVRKATEFDRLYLAAVGLCIRSTRSARRAGLVASLAIAAMGCGYSELEMQAMRDKAKQLEQAVMVLDQELQQCKPPARPE